jgi:acyl carrier protein
MTTTTKVRELVIRHTQWTGSPDELTDDVSLIERQVIDSLDLLTLISAIEEEFDVEVPDEDLVPDHFSSIGKIAAYVDARRQS